MTDLEFLDKIANTARALAWDLSPAAAELVCQDLNGYSRVMVSAALDRCRVEIKPGRMCLAEIIERLPDGRPGVEEAWAMLVWDEKQTLVWTEEMATAQGVAKASWEMGDRIGAKRAFAEVYERLVSEFRLRKLPAKWTVSLGTDKHARQTAIDKAVSLGRLSASYAASLLPPPEPNHDGRLLIEAITKTQAQGVTQAGLKALEGMRFMLGRKADANS